MPRENALASSSRPAASRHCSWLTSAKPGGHASEPIMMSLDVSGAGGGANGAGDGGGGEGNGGCGMGGAGGGDGGAGSAGGGGGGETGAKHSGVQAALPPLPGCVLK